MAKSDGLSGLRKRPVSVPVGGAEFWIKPLTVGQREAFAAWRRDNPQSVEVVSRLVAASLCDADGALLLADHTAAADLDARLCDELCTQIMRLNGMTPAEAPTDPKADSTAPPA